MARAPWQGNSVSGRQPRRPSRLDIVLRVMGGDQAACRLLGCTRFRLYKWRIGKRPLPVSVAQRLITIAEAGAERLYELARELKRELPALAVREREQGIKLWKWRDPGCDPFLPGDPRNY